MYVVQHIAAREPLLAFGAIYVRDLRLLGGTAERPLPTAVRRAVFSPQRELKRAETKHRQIQIQILWFAALVWSIGSFSSVSFICARAVVSDNC